MLRVEMILETNSSRVILLYFEVLIISTKSIFAHALFIDSVKVVELSN